MRRQILFGSAALLIFFTGCSTQRIHPYPELVEKNFNPKRSGVITHILPVNAEEQSQYRIASTKMMRKFCNGNFKVLSEGRADEIVGSTSSGAINKYGSFASETSIEKEKKVAIRFECE